MNEDAIWMDFRQRLIDVVRAIPEPDYPSDGAEEVVDALLPLVSTWNWLMAILDVHYPADIFTGVSGDPGPRIIALTREVDRLRQRLTDVESGQS